MKRFRCLAPTLVAVAILFLAPIAQAQVLQQIPGDAMFVIKFNKLKATSDKLGALFKKLGVTDMNPKMADPLASFKEEGKLTAGMDDAGDAALFIPNVPLQKNQEPPCVLLVPVSDYKAFLGNFADAKTEGDVSTLKFGTTTRDSYMVNWGSYAAIGSTKDVISKKPDGFTAAGVTGKELDGKDIVLYVNMKSARAQILPKLAEGRAQIIAGFEKEVARNQARQARPGAAPGAAAAAAPAADTQKFMPLAKAAISRVLDVVEQVVRDADAASYGVSFDDAGINATGLLEFAAASPSATRLAEFKNSDASLLAGLPASKYLFFGGSSFDPKVIQKFIVDFSAPVEKEFAALGDDGQAMQKYVDSIKAYVGAISTSAFGMATPSGMIGQDAIIQVVAVANGDAKTLLDAQKQMFESQQALYNLMSSMNPAMAGGKAPQVKMTFTPNAKTVDGVQFNQMTTSMGTPAPGQRMTAQQAQMQQMMTMMYGPGGANAYAGQLTDNKVVTSIGANDALISKLIASAKTDDDSLAKSGALAATNEHLPKQRMIAAYVGLDQIATTIASYAKAFGMPINFQLPGELSPVGVTLGTEGTALRGDTYIPAQTLQSLIAAGMQTYMQMQGEAQPGGPGGL